MKIKIYIWFFFFILFPIFYSSPVSASTNVDTFRVTFTPQSEKWTTIYKDSIYWLDPNGLIRGYDTKNKTEALLFEGEQPFTGFLGLVAYDGRYIVYNRFEDVVSNVNVYDTLKKENISVTEGNGSRWATDYDNNTVVYIDGGACGKLYAYSLQNNNSKLINDSVCGGARVSKSIVVWTTSSEITGYNLLTDRIFQIASIDGSSSVPDISGNYVTWILSNGNTGTLYVKNLKTGNEIVRYTGNYNMNWPSISQKYVVWGKNTSQHISGVEGINLKTGELFEIQEQGPHQNDNLNPIIEDNLVTWMAWRTGNGDIYGSILTKE